MSQESRLIRRLRGSSGSGMCPPAQPMDYRQSVIAEQDFRRTNLAEELLKIAADGFEPEEEDTWADILTEMARGALAAAEVIYPELPEASLLPEWATSGPPAAQKGVNAVTGTQSLLDAAAVIPAPFPVVRTPGSAD